GDVDQLGVRLPAPRAIGLRLQERLPVFLGLVEATEAGEALAEAEFSRGGPLGVLVLRRDLLVVRGRLAELAGGAEFLGLLVEGARLAAGGRDVLLALRDSPLEERFLVGRLQLVELDQLE